MVSSTNKTDRHDLTEILLKVALNTTTLPLSLYCLGTDTSIKSGGVKLVLWAK
jgi:hypothetical protein